MAMPFLTARWSNLVLLNYAVPDSVLLPYLPRGIELDRRDGQAFASLVAFDFLDTRVLGVAWPGFRSFAEMNLRFMCGAAHNAVWCLCAKLSRNGWSPPSPTSFTTSRMLLHHSAARGNTPPTRSRLSINCAGRSGYIASALLAAPAPFAHPPTAPNTFSRNTSGVLGECAPAKPSATK